MAGWKYPLALILLLGAVFMAGAPAAEAYVVTAGLWQENQQGQDTDVVYFRNFQCERTIALHVYDPEGGYGANHLLVNLTAGSPLGQVELWFRQRGSDWVASLTQNGPSVLNLGSSKVFGLYFQDSGTDPGFVPAATITPLGNDTYWIQDHVQMGETGPCASFVITDVSQAPIPGALWLLGSGLGSVLALGRRGSTVGLVA